jgi:Zn-dependent protease with chaperone function
MLPFRLIMLRPVAGVQSPQGKPPGADAKRRDELDRFGTVERPGRGKPGATGMAMRLLKNFLIATLVPLAALVFLYVRLAQSTGLGPGLPLLAYPFERVVAGTPGGELQQSSLVIAALGLIMLSLLAFLVAWVVSALVGKNRVAMVAVFPAFSFLTLLTAGFFVLADVALALAVAASEHASAAALLDDNSLAFLTTALILVGILTLLGLAGALLRMFHVPPMHVLGMKAHAPDHAKLLAFVDDVAMRVDAARPKHVVLGMDLGFFATNAPVRPLGEHRLKGETLYLSLPCLRLLSPGELRAVIGHELGHFAGKDTRFSMAFAPAFRGLEGAAEAVRKPIFRLPNLLGLLAAERLDYLAFLFQRNFAALSRDREFAADQKGAEAASADDLASALIKMFILTQVWGLQTQINVQRLQRGRVMRNLSISFAERVRFDVETLRMSELVKDALLNESAHPTDQHPRTSERIRALNVPVARVADSRAIAERLFPAETAGAVLDDMSFTEEQLTQHVQQIWAALGARPSDDSAEDVNKLNNLFGQLLAHMVLADHRSDDREIAVAEAEAVELVPDFDYDGFREFCRDEQALAPLEGLLEVAATILTDSGKAELMKLLEHIAAADKSVVREESAVLDKAREILMA